MPPALPESARAQGYQHPDREHLCIALLLCGGLIKEGADPGILFVDEVPRNRPAPSVHLYQNPEICPESVHQILSHVVQP